MCSNDTHKYVLNIVKIEYWGSCIPIGGVSNGNCSTCKPLESKLQ